MRHEAPLDVCAVVPVKDLVNAKQRLSAVLDGAERRELFRAMVEDVVSALVQVEAFARIVLVTRDIEVLSLARRHGVETLKEPRNLGQTEAVGFAVKSLMQAGPQTLLTVPADIPMVPPVELETLVGAHGPAPAITIAPARDELGSNAVMCSPPDALTFRFGDNSFYPHLASARDSGIEPAIVKCPGIGLDIDVPDDLRTLCRAQGRTRTLQYLANSGIARRLEQTR